MIRKEQNLLAFDTSTHVCSVALSYNGQITTLHERLERQQAARILPMIDQLLTQSALQLSQLDGIAFSCGPGSFTGIRLAASIAQGLAYGAGLFVMPVSSFQVLAQGAYAASKAQNILVAANAHLGEIYWGVYQADPEGFMTAFAPDRRCKPEDIDLPPGYSWLGIGDGWQTYPEVLQQRAVHLAQIMEFPYPHAKDLLYVAEKQFLGGGYLPADQALPNYLYDAEQWKKQK
jgi:tRNA threonylcarbamoyladenosine biosynthesis protein TsaB